MNNFIEELFLILIAFIRIYVFFIYFIFKFMCTLSNLLKTIKQNQIYFKRGGGGVPGAGGSFQKNILKRKHLALPVFMYEFYRVFPIYFYHQRPFLGPHSDHSGYSNQGLVYLESLKLTQIDKYAYFDINHINSWFLFVKLIAID